MTSVVIAAHNEAQVIGSCLASLVGCISGDEIVVVANGCTDQTAAIAREAGVRVLEMTDAGKAHALNAGDRLVSGYPRIYLDADIVLSAEGISDLECALARSPGVLAVAPTRRLRTTGRPLAVRAYFAINAHLPAFERGLFGRGAVAVSADGRARFTEFPLMIADDLFLDSLFGPGEKQIVESVTVWVDTPRRTRDLVRRLVRVRRGNAAMREAGRAGQLPGAVRPADRWSWLRDVVLPRPWLAPAGVVYVLITAWAAVLARLSARSNRWGRDESTREPTILAVDSDE